MINKKTGLIALLAGFAVSGFCTNTLTNYTAGDVLLCFRSAAKDLVVDVGPIATLTNLTPNQRYTISAYSVATQLSQVGTNGISWAAFTYQTDNTLFMTKARFDLDTQTSPWAASSGPAQSSTAARITKIPTGAAEEFSIPVFPNCTSTAIVEEDSLTSNYKNGLSYHSSLAGAYGGNFNGTFSGNPENTTDAAFTDLGMPVRSDFYWIPAGSGIANVKYLGYFEFNTNGVMTYVAYPTAVPLVKSIAHSGNVASISYKTGIYGTYVLRGTNDMSSGVAPTSWPIVTTLTNGDNSTHSYQDTDNSNAKFYIITAQ